MYILGLNIKIILDINFFFYFTKNYSRRVRKKIQA